MIDLIRHNIDWLFGAGYGIVLTISGFNLIELLIQTTVVTITAFLAKKLVEGAYRACKYEIALRREFQQAKRDKAKSEKEDE